MRTKIYAAKKYVLCFLMTAAFFTAAAAAGEMNRALPVSGKNDGGMYSTNMILKCLFDGSIVCEYVSEEIIYPASLTKIMTSLVCIEAAGDLNDTAALTEENYRVLTQKNASMAGLMPGETVSVEDLLYATMLPSGADGAVTLAEKYFGSEEACAMAMNGKADILGMHRTHFTNVTGLHDDNHYSTVGDMALLLSYALENETFRKIFTTSVYETEKTEAHPDGLVLESTLFKRLSLETLNDITLLGGKTGFTDKAGLCLATLASCNGREYILVTAGADGKSAAGTFHIVDAIHVYEGLENSPPRSIF